MSLNKNLLEEINRFRLYTNYKPGKLLSEQIINEEPKFPEPTPTPTPTTNPEDNDRTKIFGSDQTFQKFSPANKENVEIYMANDLNALIKEKQDEFLKKIPIKLKSDFSLIINNDVTLTPIDFCKMYINKDGGEFGMSSVTNACENNYVLYQLKDKTFKVKKLKKEDLTPIEVEYTGIHTKFVVENLYDEFIAKYGFKYREFFDQYKDKFLENGKSISEFVKDLINSAKIGVSIIPSNQEDITPSNMKQDANIKFFGFDIESSEGRNPIGRREFKKIIEKLSQGSEISGTFYDVFKTTNFIVPEPRTNGKNYSFLKNNFSRIDLTGLVLSIPPELVGNGDFPPTPTPTVTPTPTPEVIAFDFVVETAKNYEFDKAELTQEAKDEIDENITQKFLNILPKYQEGYLNFIKNEEIPVYAYASIDADPDAADGGRYPGCSKYGVGKGPRKEYNKCLSQARAEAVVNYLKTTQGGIFKDINFKPIGMGETCQFSNLCWKVKSPGSNEKSPYSTSDTYPDRRFSVNFPKYHADF